MPVCSVAGCENGGRISLGMCLMHYQRVRKYGDPGGPLPISKKGPSNPHWKGGRVRGGHRRRYWLRHAPDHPAASTIGYVLEHRLVMESHLGRYLTPDEVVHHLNDDPSDNRIENLEVMLRADHSRQHTLARYHGEISGADS
jgi:hypothetical protein